ncbi:CAP domain-containing protein [Peribacillus simplex]|uniref:CAP domain-containing protein n=2 Tax=Peribacillus TaxID=2675229 RepID=A0AA90PFE9_9BACI|nr:MULTISPECIES: CAP domain-containing protein [Peribacillus]MDP1420970.1 CAP domain-containing protein [Peribacillus simplex]MDP1452417.1 CAP domain-containing protein [Peribacillus frigoritolerans]
MRKLFNIVVLILLLSGLWYGYGKDIQESGFKAGVDAFAADVRSFINGPEVSTALEKLSTGVSSLIGSLTETLDTASEKESQETEKVKKPALEAPADASFSVRNIEMGDTKDDVEKLAGEAKRNTRNEYGVDWFAYHENYQNFFMVAYDTNNKVVGLYTNQDLISSKEGIKRGTPKETVTGKLEDPVTKLLKGNVYYQIRSDSGEYDMFEMDNSYVTIFYDKHEKNTVTAIQIIDAKLEKQKSGYFAEAGSGLKKGFEYQLFDLTNASRVNHDLSVLSWDKQVKVTAQDHSADMAVNQYFNHTNLEGESPFDRMEDDKINFRMAGENLAAGQNSSIFAHEGLMNSIGHRENKLQKDFESLGVGVAFDEENKPYYTENYLTK